MAAPDLETLLDFETNIESAAETFLATDTGLTAGSIFVSLDEDDLVLPRLGVMFELGEALDPPTQKSASDATLAYSEYTGTLTVRIVTRASLDGANVDHRSYRSKVRKSLLINATNFETQSGNIIVSGAGSSSVNGVYEPNGTQNGKPVYLLTQLASITWTGSVWIITDEQAQIQRYQSLSDVATPDLATGWDIAENADLPIPTVTAETILPYYDIKYLRPGGTVFEIDGDLAISTLTYEIRLGIRTDAWP